MQALDRAGAQVVRRANTSSGLKMLCHRHDLMITEELESGPIETPALIVSPEPKVLQEVEAFGRKFAPTRDPPDLVFGFSAATQDRLLRGLTTLVKPLETADFVETAEILAPEIEEVAHVVVGVLEHLGTERTFAPVGFLGCLGELHPVFLLQQIGEPELVLSQETGRHLGIKNGLRNPIEGAVKKGDVVISPVHPDHLEAVHKGDEIGQSGDADGERINDRESTRDGKLDETELCLIRMHAVRFGIDRACPEVAGLLRPRDKRVKVVDPVDVSLGCRSERFHESLTHPGLFVTESREEEVQHSIGWF